MKKVYLAIIIISVLIGSICTCCSLKNDYKTASFKGIGNDSVFTMSQIFEGHYDSFYVVPPYYGGECAPDSFAISDKYHKVCTRRLESFDDACIILLSQKNQVQAYSIIPRGGADGVDLCSLPLLKAIPMNKELTMTSNRKVIVMHQ